MIIKQIKYYNEDDQKFLNNPLDITAEQLVSGFYFSNVICNEIRIKTYPGTLLEINEKEVIIGETGVYNILYDENVKITSLKINEESIEFIKNTPLAYLIITFIQDDANAINSSTNISENSEGDSSEESSKDEQSDNERKEEIPSNNHDNRITKN